jgi:hypothetical protein
MDTNLGKSGHLILRWAAPFFIEEGEGHISVKNAKKTGPTV